MGWKTIVAFKWYSNYVSTNADRLRSMAVEELAKWMATVETGVNTYDESVYSHWLNWLKAPVEVDE